MDVQGKSSVSGSISKARKILLFLMVVLAASALLVHEGQVQALPGDFVRGDANADGTIDITDCVFLLSYFFVGGPAPPCDDAADVNNDGFLNIADPIYKLSWLFLGGPALPPPNVCGPDPPLPVDALGCAVFPPCC